MKLTDPSCIVWLIIGATAIATLGFITGAHLRGLQARREQMKLWSDAERLYRQRSLLDLRDNTPRP